MNLIFQTIKRLKYFRHIIVYGLALALLIFVLKWLQWKFIIMDNAIDIYIGMIAVLFTLLGIWVAKQLAKTQVEKIFVEKEIFIPYPNDGTINEKALEIFNLTQREYEILQLIVKGLSNADIASSLFLSLSTVKTHIYNLYMKLEVKRRSQAIEKAQRLKLV
ncbi:MAG TPA: LuxR C-terminal-related transcriptional regulator [Saprospiraceae bacterium]|nr:LuxR C-terminal-related transcriptional regulator [Saprospiraceae bacterium]